MNRSVILIFVLLTANVWVACSSDKRDDAQTIKVGVILPLTGGGAEWGNASKNAYELSLKVIKNKYPNLKIILKFADSKTDSKTALAIFNKYTSIENIKIIMGLLVSSNVLTIAPIAEKNKILVISNGASNPEISNAGDYIFRTWQSDALEGKADYNYAIDSLKWKDIIVLYSENGYGKGLSDIFVRQLKENGINPVSVESFKIGQKNFRNIIAKINKQKCDGIYIASYPNEVLLLLKQLKEYGSNCAILGTQSFDDNVVKSNLSMFNFKITYSIPIPADTSDKNVKKFIRDYKEEFGQYPAITADAAYDALQLVAEAIMKNGYDIEKIKDFLYNVKDYPGVSGKLTINKYGDVEKPFVFVKSF